MSQSGYPGLQCAVCLLFLKNTTRLRDHYHSEHPDYSPFLCGTCGQRFKYRTSLKKHSCPAPKGSVLKDLVISGYDRISIPVVPQVASVLPVDDVHKGLCVTAVISPPAVSTPDGVELRPKLFQAHRDFKSHISGCTSFEDWLREYDKVTEFTEDFSMSTGVQVNMVRFIRTLLMDYPTLFERLNDADLFGDALDFYIDDQVRAYNLQTVVQRLRYIKWYLYFQVNTNPDTNLEILTELETTISSMQTASTISSTNNSLHHIYDPHRLVRFSNDIVTLLRKIQSEQIDPYISRFFRTDDELSRASQEPLQFGLRHLRYFIELGLRFTNVPCRIECTKQLVMPDYVGSDFVCKLVISPKGMSRLINQDKTGKCTLTVPVPVDPFLTSYLMFYITYCRVKPDSPYVFQSSRGGNWITASRDLKQYLRDQGVNCDVICPNGRFIHGSRNIGLAVYTVLSNGNIDKIRNFATLMRHQLINVEHIYSPWMKMYQSQAAGQDMARLRNWPSEVKDQSQSVLALVSAPKSDVKRATDTLLRQFLDEGLASTTDLLVSTRDVGTQVDPGDLLETGPNGSLDPTPSVCPTCQQQLVVYGPVGLKRSPHFGQYFAQCSNCDSKQHPSSSACFYPLGVKPTLPSRSNKNRNADDVFSYIFQKTGKNLR
jgi:hypothetical protein